MQFINGNCVATNSFLFNFSNKGFWLATVFLKLPNIKQLILKDTLQLLVIKGSYCSVIEFAIPLVCMATWATPGGIPLVFNELE